MYSEDLRKRAIEHYVNSDDGIHTTAAIFGVAVNSLQDWRVRVHETGDVAPRPHGGGAKRVLTGRNLYRLKKWIAEDPDITDPELVARFHRIGVIVGRSTVNRVVREEGITRKKRHPKPAKARKPATSPSGPSGTETSADATCAAPSFSTKQAAITA